MDIRELNRFIGCPGPFVVDSDSWKPGTREAVPGDDIALKIVRNGVARAERDPGSVFTYE
jgi:hypothetical protein